MFAKEKNELMVVISRQHLIRSQISRAVFVDKGAPFETMEARLRCVRASDPGARGLGFDPHSGRCVMSLSKIHLPPKSTGNTQEAVAPSRHD